jgi:hypothetical protein
LVAGWKPSTGENKGQPDSTLRMTFSPREYRRWLARSYAIEFADSEHGPKALPLTNESLVEVVASGDDTRLSIKVSTSRELLAEWFQSRANQQ